MIIIFGRRDVSISPGQTFHLPAAQEANKQQLLEIFRAAEPVMGEIAKVKPRTWRDMKGLFSSMEAAGRMNIFGNFTGKMKNAALFPLNVMTARLGFMIEGLMMPLLPIVNRITAMYTEHIMRNQTGALIGGAIGYALGSVIGHPVIGAVAGSVMGSIAEDIGERLVKGVGTLWQGMTSPFRGGGKYDMPNLSLRDLATFDMREWVEEQVGGKLNIVEDAPARSAAVTNYLSSVEYRYLRMRD